MKLHTVNNDGNKYCGPAAVSAIAGVSTTVASELMRRASGRKFIKGAGSQVVSAALRMLGFSMLYMPRGINVALPSKSLSLARWVRATSRARGSRTFLISCGNHWRVIQGRRYVCGWTKEVVNVKSAPKLRAKVKDVWEITKSHAALVSIKEVTVTKKATPAQRSNQAARAKVKALLRTFPQVKCEVEMEGNLLRHIWVTCAEGALNDGDKDPFGGDHIVANWVEALPRVEEYVGLLSQGGK